MRRRSSRRRRRLTRMRIPRSRAATIHERKPTKRVCETRKRHFSKVTAASGTARCFTARAAARLSCRDSKKIRKQSMQHCAPPRLRRRSNERSSVMIVTTTENIAGRKVSQTIGQVFGVVVRSRGLGGNIMASLRSLVGGEIKEYTQLLEEARRHAVDRLVQNAQAMGADAITMMRYDSSEIGASMSEIVAYGTAAVIEPLPG